MKITENTIEKIYRAGKSSVETMEYKGYELIEELFVDSSGFGLESEPAFTASSFERELKTLLSEYGELTAKITGVGMFQVYVGLFKKGVKKYPSKIVASNVLEIQKPDCRVIRLYDTDIITFYKDRIVLNTGGFNTVTTSKRINQFLTNGYVYRKNWVMYCGNTPFNDDNTLTISL